MNCQTREPGGRWTIGCFVDQLSEHLPDRSAPPPDAEEAPVSGPTTPAADVLPGLRLLPDANGRVLSWAQLVKDKQEVWPIQYVLPGGAYLR